MATKTLWHTIQIKVPAEMIELTKTGKVSVKKTLTKTLNISKSQKKPAIKLIPANISEPEIVNTGKQWDIDELKSRMTKANQLAKNNKDKNIFEPKMKRYINSEKFEKAVGNRARELGQYKKLNDLDIIINDVKLLKDIKLKENEDLIKIGSFINPNPPKGPDTSKLSWNSRALHSSDASSYYTNIIDYYWDNAYKEMKPQPIPTDDELDEVSNKLWYLTKKFHVVKGKVLTTFAIYASDSLDQMIKSITTEQHKIIMKIAYNDSINKNHKYLYKACRIHQAFLDDIVKEEAKKKVAQQKAWDERTPKQVAEQKAFEARMAEQEMEFI